MAARTDNHRAGSQASQERLGPRTDNYRRLVVDENDIEAGIWQHAVHENVTRTCDCLRPQAKQMTGER
jgi:hypothetical protein